MKRSFSAPKKLKMLCKMSNQTSDAKQTVFGVKHTNKFVARSSGLVYRIPLSCMSAYIGQSGRCVIERLRERNNLGKQISAPGHLAAHCARYGCSAEFDRTTIPFRSTDHDLLYYRPAQTALRQHAAPRTHFPATRALAPIRTCCLRPR